MKPILGIVDFLTRYQDPIILNLFLLNLAIILFLISVIAISYKAIKEGREFRFWPLKIGARLSGKNPFISSSHITNASALTESEEPVNLTSIMVKQDFGDTPTRITKTKKEIIGDREDQLTSGVSFSSFLTNPVGILYIFSGQQRNFFYILTGESNQVLIGRGDNCDLILSDPSVTRMHVKVCVTLQETDAAEKDYRFEVTDFGSANGSFVNGIQFQQTELTNGDILRLGNVAIKFHRISNLETVTENIPDSDSK